MLQPLVVRTWLTTNEVKVMLGGVTQQYVSKLVRKGVLAVERDTAGYYKYDRATAEAYARKQAAIAAARDGESPDERAAMKAEAHDRFRRQRQREIEEEKKRQAHLDELREREVIALEGIHKCLLRR